MPFRLMLTVLLLLTFGAFVAVNWSAFITPTPLWLGFATVDAPLGALLLAVLVGTAALFLGYMAWWQGRMLLETRRHTQELQTQRALADQAEASRFTALQVLLQTELARLAERVDTRAAETREALQDSGNTLAAYIGEVEDRFEKALDPERRPPLR